MPKAIQITKANKSGLEMLYNMAEDNLQDAEGLFLVAEFGADHYSHILLPSTLDASYTRGVELQNDYFEVRKK